jgi:hypothetical protein
MQCEVLTALPSFTASTMRHVDQCLADINAMGKFIRGVATNGRGTVFLYGNGGCGYTPHIPRTLYQKLSHLRANPSHARPSYVSLGTKERYFVCFLDGTYAYRGPKALERELKQAQVTESKGKANGRASGFRPPLSISFGSTFNTFFIVLNDGSWKFQGRIPAGLKEKLEERQFRGDLVTVSLGADGEAWFMKARNGRMWWGGLSDDLDEQVQALLESKVRQFLLVSLCLVGTHSTFLLRRVCI